MDVIKDPEIDIVVELIGGYEPARTVITEALKNGKSVVRESSQAMYEKFQNGTYNIWQKGTRRKPKTQQDYERNVLNRYDQSLSEMTDALIPEIPQEYVISFNLTDSDKQLYNMYEVNIEGDFGIFDKGGLKLNDITIKFRTNNSPENFNRSLK